MQNTKSERKILGSCGLISFAAMVDVVGCRQQTALLISWLGWPAEAAAVVHCSKICFSVLLWYHILLMTVDEVCDPLR